MGKAANKKRRKYGHPACVKAVKRRVNHHLNRQEFEPGVLFTTKRVNVPKGIGQWLKGDVELEERSMRVCSVTRLTTQLQVSQGRKGYVSWSAWAHKPDGEPPANYYVSALNKVAPRGRVFRKMYRRDALNPWVK